MTWPRNSLASNKTQTQTPKNKKQNKEKFVIESAISVYLWESFLFHPNEIVIWISSQMQEKKKRKIFLEIQVANTTCYRCFIKCNWCPKLVQISCSICTPENQLTGFLSAQVTNWIDVMKKMADNSNYFSEYKELGWLGNIDPSA